MYLIQFLTSLTKKSNIPVLIYLILNLAIIAWFVYVFLSFNGAISPNVLVCVGITLLVYALSLAVALSPVGEWILRKQNGCKKMENQELLSRIGPIFNEVYAKAKETYPDLSEGIKLYVKDRSRGKRHETSCEVNAFAAGRNTICVTEGLLYQPEDQIKGVLGHEFGHLANHDTDVTLVVVVGNLIINSVISCTIIFCNVMKFIFGITSSGRDGIVGMVGLIMTAIFVFLINLMNRIWSQIGVWLCMKSSRDNEFLADEFSYKLGYGIPLCEFLNNVARGDSSEGLFAALASSHPNTDDRIARLQKLGCEYKKSYGK